MRSSPDEGVGRGMEKMEAVFNSALRSRACMVEGRCDIVLERFCEEAL